MTGATLRDLGLAQVANSHPEFITIARKTLDALIRLQGRATIDEVRDILAAAGIYPDSSHAWGAVPAGKRYVCIGRQQSKRPSSRARTVCIWAHSVPTLDYAPPKREGSESYYYRIGLRQGSYRVQY
jgi:hypothetical protein